MRLGAIKEKTPFATPCACAMVERLHAQTLPGYGSRPGSGDTWRPSGSAYGSWRPNVAASATAVCTFCSNAKALR